MKVVINRCFGRFGLSAEAYKELGLEWDGLGYHEYMRNRNDPKLVAVVEKLGKRANGKWSELRVIEIPDGIEYDISDWDGLEMIEAVHMRWC